MVECCFPFGVIITILQFYIPKYLVRNVFVNLLSPLLGRKTGVLEWRERENSCESLLKVLLGRVIDLSSRTGGILQNCNISAAGKATQQNSFGY